MTFLVSGGGIGVTKMTTFLGGSSVPWCPLSNLYFEVSCPVLACKGSEPWRVFFVCWVVLFGGAGSVEDTSAAWPGSISSKEKNLNCSADCASKVQKHSFKDVMVVGGHLIPFWNTGLPLLSVVNDKNYLKASEKQPGLPWLSPLFVGLPNFQAQNYFSFPPPEAPMSTRCTSTEARPCLLSLCKKRCEKNLASVSHCQHFRVLFWAQFPHWGEFRPGWDLLPFGVNGEDSLIKHH